MLVDKLLLSVGIEDHGEAVKAFDNTVQLEAVHKEHGYTGPVFS